MRKGFRHTEETKARIGAASRERKAAAIATAANIARAADKRAKQVEKPAKKVLTPDERKANNLRRAAEWAAKNPERAREIKRRHYEKKIAVDRERMNAAQREKNQQPERKRYMRSYMKAHRAANPDVWVGYTENRRAAKAGAPGSHSVQEWRALMKSFWHCCAYCGTRTKLERDHVIPLSRTELNPTNYIDNILPACLNCNSQKGAKTDWEFRRWLYDTNAWEGKCLPSV